MLSLGSHERKQKRNYTVKVQKFSWNGGEVFSQNHLSPLIPGTPLSQSLGKPWLFEEAPFVSMLCTPDNQLRPFSYHSKMADQVFSCFVRFLVIFTWAEGTESRNAVRFFFLGFLGVFWGRASDWLVVITCGQS